MSLSLPAQNAELRECKSALFRALRQKNNDSIATAYCHLSEYYAYRSADTTKYYCSEGLKYANKNTLEPYMTLIINLACAYVDEGNVDEALQRHLFSLKEAERLNYDKENKSSILTSIGVSYRRKELPDSALFYYKKALALLEDAGLDANDNKVHLLASMAVLYANTSRLKEGEYYARKSVDLSTKCDDIDMVHYAATTAGAVLVLQDKHEEGAQILRSVLSRSRAERKPKYILKSLTYLLTLFQRTANNDSINHYVIQAEEEAQKMSDTSMEVLGYYLTLSQIYTAMGRYKESLDIQHRLLKMREVNSPAPIERLYLEMARSYKALKAYPQACEFYEKAYKAADSLHAEQLNTELSELSVKYKTQEKELEIARLVQEQLKQKAKTMQWGIVAGIAISICLLFMFYYIYRRKRIKREAELNLAKSYIDGLERERTRLAKELHDGVCNDLLGIGMQMQCMQPTNESKQELLILLEQVRTDVRYISHELMPPKFQYTTLDETMEAYIERLAIPASIDIIFNKDETAEWSKIPERIAYEAYRILQESLSNILQHAKATTVYVHLSLNESRLSLLITNNGKVCISAEDIGTGIGLTTTRERVKAIGGILVTDMQAGKQMIKLEISLPV